MELKEITLTPLLDTLRLEKISDDIYFSEKYSGYVSNSRLGLLNPRQQGSPEQFFEGFKSGGFSSSLMLGSAIHELTLQPEYFELADDTKKPTAKLGMMADELYPIYVERKITYDDIVKASDKIDYYKGKLNKEKALNVINSSIEYWKNRQMNEFKLETSKEIIYLDYKSLEITKSCVESLAKNYQVQKLLNPGEDIISENEQAILLDVEAKCPNGKTFTIRLKSKLDNYTIDVSNNTIVVNDVKTIGRMVNEIDSNITRFHYSREFAMYMYLLKLCSEKFYNMSSPKMQANYLVVSTVPNFYSKVRPVTYQELMDGFHEFKTLLKYVAYLIGYKNYSFDKPKFNL
jgi:hypothetical protein